MPDANGNLKGYALSSERSRATWDRVFGCGGHSRGNDPRFPDTCVKCGRLIRDKSAPAA